MSEQQKNSKTKELISPCGTRFLTGVGIAASALAAASPFLDIPNGKLKATAAGLFAISATANYFAEKIGKEKSQWLKKVQNTALAVSICGFAVATGSYEVVADKQRIEEAKDFYKPVAVATGKIGDPELEKYYSSLSSDMSMEDMLKLAMVTSAKNLKQNKEKTQNKDNIMDAVKYKKTNSGKV